MEGLMHDCLYGLKDAIRSLINILDRSSRCLQHAWSKLPFGKNKTRAHGEAVPKPNTDNNGRYAATGKSQNYFNRLPAF